MSHPHYRMAAKSIRGKTKSGVFGMTSPHIAGNRVPDMQQDAILASKWMVMMICTTFDISVEQLLRAERMVQPPSSSNPCTLLRFPV